MGESRSAAELAGKLGAVGVAMSQVPKIAVNKAAVKVDRVFFDEANKSIGGTMIAGRKWGTTVKPAKSNTNPQAVVKYRGKVHLIESPTKPHTIISRKYGGSKATRGAVTPGPGMFAGRRRGAVTVGGRPFAYARHPGTKGRPFFGRVKAKAPDVAVRELKTATHEAMIKGLR